MFLFERFACAAQCRQAILKRKKLCLPDRHTDSPLDSRLADPPKRHTNFNEPNQRPVTNRRFAVEPKLASQMNSILETFTLINVKFFLILTAVINRSHPIHLSPTITIHHLPFRRTLTGNTLHKSHTRCTDRSHVIRAHNHPKC